MEWMILPLKRYAQFSGRSRRLEYWMFTLFQLLVYLALSLAAAAVLASSGGFDDDQASSGAGVSVILVFLAAAAIIWLGFLVPNLAVIARRMQDQNISGAVGIILYLVGLVIGLTSLVLFVLALLPGTKGPNQYGDDPKGESSGDIFA